MKKRIFLPCLLLTQIAGAAPVVSSVMNAASNVSGTLPNGSLAPGSIFIVKGTGLGPTKLTIAPSAFQTTTLSGTSVSLTIAGTTVQAPMYYTSDKQIAALLPSNTPTGTGTITVTYNNQSSPATAIRGVTSNNLGIFTIDSTGGGVGIFTYPDYSLVSPFKAANCGGPNTTCGAANPGDTLILWGTGLGAITGDDAAGAGLGVNQIGVPLQLWIGNVKAAITYQGRSGCCIGEDQVVFKVPDNVVTGCAVPVTAQIGNQVNQVTMSIAPKGVRSCSSADVPGLSAASFTAPFTLGALELDHFQNDNGVGFHDQAKFFFARIRSLPPVYQPFISAIGGEHSAGTCNISNGNGAQFGDVAVQDAALLDAGTTFLVKGPSGSQTVTGATGADVPLDNAGNFIVPGDYTITGTGGKDVGAFTATVTLPPMPTLTSPTGSISVTRNQGLTVTWTPTATGHVEIALLATDAFNVSTVTVACTAPSSAGTFTIPNYITFALPTTTHGVFFFQPGDQGPAVSSTFTASGLDLGLTQIFAGNVTIDNVTIK